MPDAVKGITARELGGHMKFLASDLMRGRDTASHETRIAAEYLASRLSAAGAQPAGDAGRRRQDATSRRFPLEIVTPQLEGTSVTLLLEQNGSKRVVPCQLGVDVTFQPWGIAAGEIEAPVVFAGFGEVDAAKQIDDYDGIDVERPIRPDLRGPRPGQNAADGRPAERRPLRARRRRGGFSIARRRKRRSSEAPSESSVPSSTSDCEGDPSQTRCRRWPLRLRPVVDERSADHRPPDPDPFVRRTRSGN